ncbi:MULTISPECIES: MSMEG_1061 family FMN-dependent PPOX-type flavoprotein [Yersinia]|uniref:Pyridoxamine 5'-phosphate oxidase, FMN-binding family protein n=1 Tax=Yersinia rochesterensis TaxID=1604335 RepID=A0A386HCY0_9GAMM|nr:MULTISPECIES: MSMEG_1061 family FMN-dependent PPOX-type flavoprotein [Yersinia]AJI86401.1 pyridoxamine 5'-phosphate oxidase, FMN-binding family protein [Yersinia frederiksenii Y225]CNG98268.1 phosphohydrolase [Yersinia kristensenii]AIN18568.1 pyridoxamine 5'-phosphate oxidase, FMN-binding family protein [Yersinia rochesterensis]AJJ36417.1 pyridoxamine 5'-phosphate oxidase, FMN-binding family protein [Yersinia rochesterensis]AYD43394.1 pyridoxamine 5-phosphate oxidase [Yersinia rochesterensi
MSLKPEYILTTEAQLSEHYASPNQNVLKKQIDHIDDYAKKLIAAAPFAVLGTLGANGIDCSPKGGDAGFIHVQDSKTLMLPDRAGNNRLDGIRNLLHNPFIGILFLIPGWTEGFRVNGRAKISIDPQLCERFSQNGHPARSVLVIEVDEVFIHCGRAITFADLWNPEKHVEKENVPTALEVFKAHLAINNHQLS